MQQLVLLGEVAVEPREVLPLLGNRQVRVEGQGGSNPLDEALYRPHRSPPELAVHVVVQEDVLVEGGFPFGLTHACW